MGFWLSDARLARVVAALRTEQAGFDGPKDRVRSPQIKSKTASEVVGVVEGIPALFRAGISTPEPGTPPFYNLTFFAKETTP